MKPNETQLKFLRDSVGKASIKQGVMPYRLSRLTPVGLEIAITARYTNPGLYRALLWPNDNDPED